jgi:hypothetical protein
MSSDMQVEATLHKTLRIPPENDSIHAVEYSKRAYRRVLANWASDLLTALAEERRKQESQYEKHNVLHAA